MVLPFIRTIMQAANQSALQKLQALRICLTFWLCWNISNLDIVLPGVGGISKAGLPPCKHLSEDHETLLILRTGATEIADRIPAHISTSLRCVTQHVIFSDYTARGYWMLSSRSTQTSWPTTMISIYIDAFNNTVELHWLKAS